MEFESIEEKIIYEKIMARIKEISAEMNDSHAPAPNVEITPSSTEIPVIGNERLNRLLPEIHSYINTLTNTKECTFYRPILTHRKILKPFVVFIKRVIRKATFWLISPICNQQTIFNDAVVPSIGCITELISHLKETQENLTNILQSQSQQIQQIKTESEQQMQKVLTESAQHLQQAKAENEKQIRQVMEETTNLLNNTRLATEDTKSIVGDTKQIVEGIKKTVDFFGDADFQFNKLRNMLNEIEYYQPAYMIGGINLTPKRECKDRCRAIEKALDGNIAGLKILDIGSNLGYVCYYFADRGAVTEGWENDIKHAETARLIGQINGLRTSIKSKEFNMEEIEQIKPGDYDVIMFLSVLHHVIHFNGLRYAQEAIKKTIEKIPVLIAELAVKNEDATLFWNEALPDNELAVFDLVKDEIIIDKIGVFSTHLSSIERPLYKITKKEKIVLVNSNFYSYDYKTNVAYKDSTIPYIAPAFRRCYYFSQNYIIKEYFLNEVNDNMEQIITEMGNILFLNRRTNVKSSQLIDYELNNKRAVLVLARDKGDLISDIINEKKICPEKVTKDVLEFLSALEENNYYHNDIRSWNLLWDGNNVHVIDYGYMSPIVFDDDIVSLLRVINAIQLKCKENSVGGKKNLPSSKHFNTPFLQKLYKIVEDGERSPKAILNKLYTKGK